MHLRILATIIAILLAACQSTPVGRAGGQSGSENGLSAKTAVIVSSVPEERTWIERHYPGATIKSQSLLMGAVPMDLIEIKLTTGETRRIYFDISSFFGKMRADNSSTPTALRDSAWFPRRPS
jgi:hypothetical protein